MQATTRKTVLNAQSMFWNRITWQFL